MIVQVELHWKAVKETSSKQSLEVFKLMLCLTCMILLADLNQALQLSNLVEYVINPHNKLVLMRIAH